MPAKRTSRNSKTAYRTKRYSGLYPTSENVGRRFQNYGSHLVKSACTADFFYKIGHKIHSFWATKKFLVFIPYVLLLETRLNVVTLRSGRQPGRVRFQQGTLKKLTWVPSRGVATPTFTPELQRRQEDRTGAAERERAAVSGVTNMDHRPQGKASRSLVKS